MGKFLVRPSVRFGLSLAFVVAGLLAMAGHASADPIAITPADGIDVTGVVAGIGTVIFAVLAAVLGISVAVLTAMVGWKFVRGIKKA